MYYDAKNANCRTIVNNQLDLLDMVNQVLLPFTVLIDPELAAIRLQAQPHELASMIQLVQGRIQSLMDLSDEVVAFDHPHFTAKMLPRLQQYVQTYRRDPTDWIAARRVRQLRMCLIEHWLKTPPERIGQEYFADPGRAHHLLLESGIRRANIDVREQDILDKVYAELLADPASKASWGRWLALVLLANFQSLPDLKLEMVPDWLQPDFATHAWMA
jgi:hypothetical protein